MITRFKFEGFGASLIAGTVASILAACASGSARAADAVAAAAPPARLQSAAALRDRARPASQVADAAVRVAEPPGAEFHPRADRDHMTDQRVDLARAHAEGTRLGEEHPPGLRTEGERAHVDQVAGKLDLEQDQAVLAELAGAGQILAAISARGEPAVDRATATAILDPQAPDARREAECAELAASISRQQTAPRQPKGDLLQASVTGSGLVVSLAGFAILR
jgi:antitoxin component of MazEF toxin-antitoxin module